VLVLDEPANGLDPQGIRWLRDFLRGMAGEGRTVLVSSHVLSELEEMADDAVFISRGRTVVPETTTAQTTWHVRALSLGALTTWLTSVGATWRPGAGGSPDEPGGVLMEVAGDEGAARLVRDAVAAGVPLTSLGPVAGALEQAYLTLEEERR
jgi:ABC-2 type transport system ATP-binding protein